ncbi:MAG TPA: hypothetical protein VHE35_17815 [Kofleriaceae bacterium]|nr:hypothetical protein [Kofleriaceae bacterium]
MLTTGVVSRVYLRSSLVAAGALAALALAGCGGGGPGGGGDDVAADPDAAQVDVDAPAIDVDAGQPIDAAPPIDAPAESWATYHIAVGAHSATITGGSDGNPVNLVTSVAGRDFRFAFNSSAVYTITNPVEPQDQLDWNKLPGLSDCGTVDLSVNGLMFGWRWRLDTNPKVLEVTAYANNNSSHLWLAQPLFTLSEAELAADAPLRYREWIDGNMYRFTVQGTIDGRTIDVSGAHPRACAATSATGLKWAGQFYFGGTSTAPSVITARIHEIPFAP